MASRRERQALPSGIIAGQPLTALAPMQDVTTLGFMGIVDRYGPPDFFFTEYFRVHPHSRLEPHILASITENRSARPVFAQMIGSEPEHLERTARELATYPIAGIDLNLGCPAPKVYKKNAGGGLLREPEHIRAILEAIAGTEPVRLTVKMRLGFEDYRHLEAILDILESIPVDLLSLHGRTVMGGYRSAVDYASIGEVAQRVSCPLLINGNLATSQDATSQVDQLEAAGAMIGRAAIRNPWIFRQFRERRSGQPVFQPTLRDVRGYIDDLWEACDLPGLGDPRHVARMKKFTNFIGQGVDPEGSFLHLIRRAQDAASFFAICDRFLLERPEAAFPDQPYPGLVARPNREGKIPTSCADAA